MKKRILVIDDDPEIIDLYQRVLIQKSSDIHQRGKELFDLTADNDEEESNFSLSKFEIVTATQGLEGVEKVADSVSLNRPFATAFIDMRMPPGIDGLETARQIKDLDPEIKIVFVTAYSDRNRAEISKVLGKHRFFYLKKPCDPDELRQLAEVTTFWWETSREKNLLEEEKEIFISNMSHELRHPLQIILGVCDTVINFDMEKVKRTQFLQDIENEAKRLFNLVEKLGTLNQLEGRSLLEELKPYELSELLHNVCRLMKKDVANKGLKFKLVFEDDLGQVMAESNRLHQVLINLLVNAIQNTEKGEITLSAKKVDSSVRISVEDTGVGISNADQKQIVKRFYRVKKQALKVRGSGLGLSIVTEILRGHNSELDIASELGRGSSFSFLLDSAPKKDVASGPDGLISL
ncbi:MAG: response regulator [Proteobacteria bacterium]|nr:response regulator [Pseudomonadota bacterium]